MTIKELAQEYYRSAKQLEGRIEELRLILSEVKADSTNPRYEDIHCRRELLMSQRRDLIATAKYLESYEEECNG